MIELVEKIKNLESKLNTMELVEDINKLKSEIYSDKELVDLIKQYNDCNDEVLRENILKNKSIKRYKVLENEINFIILEINNKIKQMGL